MGSLSIWHILIIAVVVILLLGRGKISDLMGDVAKGINNFRKGLNDHDQPPPGPRSLNNDRDAAAPVNKDQTTASH
ncbi:MAG TPA: twin-arginine translocase TatA/TatE family subunit [Rhizomicrobium sp.]|jgi:sec-independent protein translocase protein TatA|nr:twin-arginine translocase TatA/TatE family subunit [Rhizomicrobium sp.]